jgi:catechol 2,3-dioxygenase-like lactoylglutathione lyase family enzyme
MTQRSAVAFDTNTRIHIGLAVSNLARSVRFYQTMFGQRPSKTRPGYAKFEVADPPVNLTLNETTGDTGPNNPVAHYGIQVQSTETITEIAGRFARAVIATEVQDHVTCCYAVQDKIWATDPDGNRWEVFVVVDNLDAASPCCAEDCCSEGSCDAKPARAAGCCCAPA